MSDSQAVPRAGERKSYGAAPAALLCDARLGAFVVAASVAQQVIGHQNGDNSWLFTVAERVLAGGTPYVDVIETNPPASFLLYMPAVALAHALHTRVEFIAAGMVFAFAGLCLALAGRILQPGKLLAGPQTGFLLNVAAFVFLFLPGLSFAEREHVAAIGLTPLLALYVARAQARPVPTSFTSLAGLLGGVCICIKPHFALVAALPLAMAMMRRRSVLPAVTSESVAIGAVLLGYAVLVLVRYTTYIDAVPLLFDVYMRMKASSLELLSRPWFVLAVGLIAALPLLWRGRFPTPAAMLLAGAAGFTGGYLLQGKGWVNHGLPAAMYAIMAAGWLVAPGVAALAREGGQAAGWLAVRRAVLFGFAPLLVGASLLFGVGLQFGAWEEHPGLLAAVRRHAPEHPRLIAASGELTVGHPLVRRLDGVWVGRPTALWLMVFSRLLLEAGQGDEAYRERLALYIDRDARMFREDVERGKPDLILIDDDGPKLLTHPQIAAALANYAPVETVGDVAVWGRKP